MVSGKWKYAQQANTYVHGDKKQYIRIKLTLPIFTRLWTVLSITLWIFILRDHIDDLDDDNDGIVDHEDEDDDGDGILDQEVKIYYTIQFLTTIQ